MAKLLILIGVTVILHTLLAKYLGIPEITDYMPLEWFNSSMESEGFQKIIPSNSTLKLSIYTFIVGGALVFFGSLLLYFKQGN